MTELVQTNAPTLQEIQTLQHEVSKLPQLELATEHYCHGGMYCRKVFMPAGTVVVGKVHKTNHFFLCAKGEIIVTTDKGVITLTAGDVIESKPKTKRAIYAQTDSIIINFHKTSKTNLDKIEKELVEHDDLSMFDARNKLKVLKG
jgi:hypothetical protein